MKSRSSIWVAALAMTALASACKKPPVKGPPPDAGPPADHEILIQGVVTDASTNAVIPGVTITLLGEVNGWGTPQGVIPQPDAGGYYTQTQTDNRGYFSFPVSADVHNLLVQYQKDGYQTRTLPINPAAAVPETPCRFGDAGMPCNAPSNLGVVDASAAMTQIITVQVAGWVYAGAMVANGAQVEIVTPDAPTTPLYTTTTNDKGYFNFPKVLAGTYNVLVLPFDSDGASGVDNYQLFTYPLGAIPAAGENLTDIVINLQDTAHVISGGTLINLNQPYPITIPQLMANNIVGVEAPLTQFSLTFGAEVDPNLTSFELVQYDQVNRNSAPIPIAMSTSWANNVTVTFKPMFDGPDGGPTPSLPGYTTYELRITSLRFADGTIAIPPTPDIYGSIDFTIQELPPLPPNPTPSWYITGNPLTPNATQAVVDASNIWLLDKNNDFIFDTDPNRNWGPNNLPQITWQHVDGALAYHVYARTVAPGPLGTEQQWQEIAPVTPDTSTNLNPMLTATINPYQMEAVYDPLMPWLYGNTMQIAVTSEDAAGFQSPIDTTKLLATTDTFPGLVVGGEVDPNVPPPFNVTTEHGHGITKTIRIDFSEPMNPTFMQPNAQSPGPFLKALSSTIALAKPPAGPVTQFAWGTKTAPSLTPVNSASSLYVKVSMTDDTPCTETLVDRFAGDTVIQVRDPSVFMVDSMPGIVAFLDPNTGAFVDESFGVTAVTPGNPATITVTQPLLATKVPAGSLACALDNTVSLSTAGSVFNQGQTALPVATGMHFHAGETMLIYEPRYYTPAGAIVDVRQAVAYDSSNGTLYVDQGVSNGHRFMETVVFPVTLGGEYQLRPKLDLTADVVGDTQGMGQGTTIYLSQPEPIAYGDTVLIDADGNLATTTDQYLLSIDAVSADFTRTPSVNSFQVNLPSTVFLFEKTSKVIDLGDALFIDGVHDTTPLMPMMPGHLNTHRNRLTADGFVYGGPVIAPE